MERSAYLPLMCPPDRPGPMLFRRHEGGLGAMCVSRPYRFMLCPFRGLLGVCVQDPGQAFPSILGPS